MEIKKGISQMPEYPNQEINYVVPTDGKMYYVLKDGILEDGTIVATLDPKYAFDQSLPCTTVGAFKEDGSVLIDFNKKEIKKIGSDLLLAVHSIPVSSEVIDAKVKEADETSKNMIIANGVSITDKMINEMGITGEMLFSDAFGEANVYKTDSYNNKIGVDASFIGKTSKDLYFHTNDINGSSKIVRLDAIPSNGDSSLEEAEMISPTTISDKTSEIPKIEEVEEKEVESLPEVETPDDLETTVTDLKLDIGQDILDGFSNESTKKSDVEVAPVISEDVEEEEKKENTVVSKTSEDIEKEMNDSPFELPTSNTSPTDAEGDEVLDNVITVMKKMIEESKKLNDRITNLEQEIAQKDKVIEEQESKKDELSDLLDQANEVLENID